MKDRKQPVIERTNSTVSASKAARPNAFQEMALAIANWEFWLTLAYMDIRGRYRRTVLGPLWSGLNSLFFVLILSAVYSQLWRIDIRDFIPYVAAGYFTWVFISLTLIESCQILHAHSETLKTVPVSPFAMILRVIARNLMVYGHNIIIYALVALALGKSFPNLIALLPGIAIVVSFCLGVATCLAVLCTRFRDFEQIVQSVIQVVFFITPVLWKASVLPDDKKFLAELNPFFHLIAVVREPLLGSPVPSTSLLLAAAIAAVAMCAGAVAYARNRQRIVYWL